MSPLFSLLLLLNPDLLDSLHELHPQVIISVIYDVALLVSLLITVGPITQLLRQILNFDLPSHQVAIILNALGLLLSRELDALVLATTIWLCAVGLAGQVCIPVGCSR